RVLRVIEPVTGEIHAEHGLVAPGETSIDDAHYDRPRPAPSRGARPKTAVEREFLDLWPVAEQFLTGAAAAGVTKLNTEIVEILTLGAAHGTGALVAALERAVAFGRWRADDLRSILATNGHAPRPTPAGQALVMTLPTVPTRSLDAYAIQPPIEGLDGGEVS
ncbi:MAG: IS21 family transposase, partial [Nocardioidaceae bacterium]